MRQIYHARAIALKKTTSGESDMFVTVLTEEFGKISLFAKSGKKINAKITPHLDILNQSEIVFVNGKNFARITNAFVLDYFSVIKTDFFRLISGLFAIEIADQIIEEGAFAENEYRELELYLKKLDNCKENKIAYFPYIFAARFLTILGYGPLLAQKTNEAKLLRICLEYGYDVINKIDLSSIDKNNLRVILDGLLSQILRSPLNTWKILGNMIK